MLNCTKRSLCRLLNKQLLLRCVYENTFCFCLYPAFINKKITHVHTYTHVLCINSLSTRSVIYKYSNIYIQSNHAWGLAKSFGVQTENKIVRLYLNLLGYGLNMCMYSVKRMVHHNVRTPETICPDLKRLWSSLHELSHLLRDHLYLVTTISATVCVVNETN